MNPPCQCNVKRDGILKSREVTQFIKLPWQSIQWFWRYFKWNIKYYHHGGATKKVIVMNIWTKCCGNTYRTYQDISLNKWKPAAGSTVQGFILLAAYLSKISHQSIKQLLTNFSLKKKGVDCLKETFAEKRWKHCKEEMVQQHRKVRKKVTSRLLSHYSPVKFKLSLMTCFKSAQKYSPMQWLILYLKVPYHENEFLLFFVFLWTCRWKIKAV